MKQTYFAILTAIGEAKISEALANKTTLKLTQMAVGDGNGEVPTPERKQTTLVNEQRRASINTLSVDAINIHQLIAEQIIPEDEGGWWIREIGLFDDDGDLCAVANCPPTYKPKLAEGSGRTQIIRLVLAVTSTDVVELKIDPSIVLATREYVEKVGERYITHEQGEKRFRFPTREASYQVLPSGLILQWGMARAAVSQITFPLRFPNDVLTVHVTPAEQKTLAAASYFNADQTKFDVKYTWMGAQSECDFTWLALGY